jgi:hypothetical protein
MVRLGMEEDYFIVDLLVTDKNMFSVRDALLSLGLGVPSIENSVKQDRVALLQKKMVSI